MCRSFPLSPCEPLVLRDYLRLFQLFFAIYHLRMKVAQIVLFGIFTRPKIRQCNTIFQPGLYCLLRYLSTGKLISTAMFMTAWTVRFWQQAITTQTTIERIRIKALCTFTSFEGRHSLRNWNNLGIELKPTFFQPLLQSQRQIYLKIPINSKKFRTIVRLLYAITRI